MRKNNHRDGYLILAAAFITGLILIACYAIAEGLHKLLGW